MDEQTHYPDATTSQEPRKFKNTRYFGPKKTVH